MNRALGSDPHGIKFLRIADFAVPYAVIVFKIAHISIVGSGFAARAGIPFRSELAIGLER